MEYQSASRAVSHFSVSAFSIFTRGGEEEKPAVVARIQSVISNSFIPKNVFDECSKEPRKSLLHPQEDVSCELKQLFQQLVSLFSREHAKSLFKTTKEAGPSVLF